MRHVIVVAVLVAGCSKDRPHPAPTPAPSPAASSPAASTAPVAPSAPAPTAAPPAPAPSPAAAAAPHPAASALPADGHDFTPVAHALFAAAACGDAPMPEDVPAAIVRKHCSYVRNLQAEYRERWVARARPFFADKVPADVPKKVVYPFAGGDLSTALTVYPDADEITTLSLEPSGDPRTLAALTSARGDLGKALGTIRDELGFLYKVNFSNTMNMIDAMRAGRLPTQLVFGLSALAVHDYEVVSLRYFQLDADGRIVYLTDADLAAAPDVTRGKADARNRVFANAELGFRKRGGRVQYYRHLQGNLDDTHTTRDPRILRHLAAKNPVAAMTKAASYLLSWPAFSNIRGYLLDHVAWMVSDATGVPPTHGKAKGFVYETYGKFHQPHIGKGQEDWRAEWAAQPSRSLPFRFGYYDGSPARTNHLVIMRRASTR